MFAVSVLDCFTVTVGDLLRHIQVVSEDVSVLDCFTVPVGDLLRHIQVISVLDCFTVPVGDLHITYTGNQCTPLFYCACR